MAQPDKRKYLIGDAIGRNQPQVHRTMAESTLVLAKTDSRLARVSERTVYRWMKKDYRGLYGKPSKKLDICEKCSTWDLNVLPRALWAFVELRVRLNINWGCWGW